MTLMQWQSFILAGHLLAIAWIDARQQIIPNPLNLSLAGFGLIVAGHEIASALTAGLVTIAILLLISTSYRAIRGKTGIGLGDIKFLGAAAIWVGLAGAPWVILIGSISGLALVLAQHLLGQSMTSTSRLAFGPHLSAGLMLAWLLRDLITVQP